MNPLIKSYSEHREETGATSMAGQALDEVRKELAREGADLKGSHSATLLLLVLLSADFAFIVLHIITKATPILNSVLFTLEMDGGYPEIYQYIKFFWIIVLFIYVLKSTKCSSYVSWILVFTYFLCDDVLRIHETIGAYIAKSFDFYPPLNVRLQDFGELAVSATIGMLLLAIFAWAYLRGSHTFKKISNDMLLFIALLVFFGVFVDMVHSAITHGTVVSLGFAIAEDGGEMVVVSLILWYVFLLAIRNGDSDLFLHDLLRKPSRAGANGAKALPLRR